MPRDQRPHKTGTILPIRGNTPLIAPGVFVAPGATIIGDTEIGKGSSIWFGCTLRGDVMDIRIGERTNIQDGSVVHVTGGKFGTQIGSDVTIGHMALIHGCVLEDACFIGMKATVMDQCVVESGAMLAAGAVLTPGKRIRRGELWAGSPAKLMRALSDDEMAGFIRTAQHYAGLAAEYVEMLKTQPAS